MLYITNSFNLSLLTACDESDVAHLSIMKTDLPQVFMKDEIDFGHEVVFGVDNEEDAKLFSTTLKVEVTTSSSANVSLRGGDWALLGQVNTEPQTGVKSVSWYIVSMLPKVPADSDDDYEDEDEVEDYSEDGLDS